MKINTDYLKTPARVQRAMEDTKGHIMTWTGQLIDPLDPDPDAIRMEDISHALSLICRYNGHCHEHYSVAQHSLLVARLVRSYGPQYELAGLLHDAAEAYLGDMPSPIKHSAKMSEFRKAEDALQDVIYNKYLFPYLTTAYEDIAEKVKIADDDAYKMERISFLLPSGIAEEKMRETYNQSVIVPKKQSEVETEFFIQFADLLAECDIQSRRTINGVPLEGRGSVRPQPN